MLLNLKTEPTGILLVYNENRFIRINPLSHTLIKLQRYGKQ